MPAHEMADQPVRPAKIETALEHEHLGEIGREREAAVEPRASMRSLKVRKLTTSPISPTASCASSIARGSMP